MGRLFNARDFVFLAVLAVLPFFLITPMNADTVVLKDGRRIETREPYRVDGDQAVLVLTNGTVTMVPIASIDQKQTEEASRYGSGSAQIIDGRESRPVQSEPPSRRSTSSLSDVASQRRLNTRRTAPEAADNTPLAEVRELHTDLQLINYLDGLFTSQGLSAEVFESTGPGTATVRLATDSEADVFRSLVTTAVALLESGDKLASPLSVLELEMRSSDGGQAGDFRITHDRAQALRSRATSPQEFYVRYVEF